MKRHLAPKRILVLTYWAYSDALIQTYTLPYLRMIQAELPEGSRVHLITMEKGGTPAGCTDQGVYLHAMSYRRFGLQGMMAMAAMLLRLILLIRRERIDTIHAWCTPAGMIGYVLSVLTRRPLVLDSYEPHAEAMVENGTWSRRGLAFRLLFHFEKLQSRRAVALIACAEGMRGYARSRYGIMDKPFFVKPACVDLERFSSDAIKDPALLRELGISDKIVAVYAGKFGGIYLDQEVFDMLRVAREHWGERLHVLLLTSHPIGELENYMRQAGLSHDMFTVRFVPHAEVPRYMGLADFALTPVRPVPTKRFCTPIKDGEYWALGLPVIITKDISDDSDIIREHGIGAVITELSTKGYAKAVGDMDDLLHLLDRRELFAKVRAVAERYRDPELARGIYSWIYGKGA